MNKGEYRHLTCKDKREIGMRENVRNPILNASHFLLKPNTEGHLKELVQ